ncbi:DUF2505 domain-containing protein [Paeniglutamicibacter sp. ABSL32-1]|uniref:DUF2505 domain-containing protein n=1 Tax=Paeniglutamicibacter quisquiliarum TaxID=2849498 RepID=UPI001C2DDF82|nr:DUF2505 domain-containing protein [Paeniglutamicibacter quisquiliarum]MBV1779223.1 DUF2505 domain-containing protein [Paeniglutamicibacter quisquiliarum]
MALNATTDLTHAPDTVIATLADRDFAEHLTGLVGGELKSFEVAGDTAAAFTLTTVRTLPTDRAPEIARKFVGQSVEVTQVESWSSPAADGSREATLKVTVGSLPVSVSGTESLRATDAGSALGVEATVSSSIPFVGGKIASAAEPFISKALSLQAAKVSAWIERG